MISASQLGQRNPVYNTGVMARLQRVSSVGKPASPQGSRSTPIFDPARRQVLKGSAAVMATGALGSLSGLQSRQAQVADQSTGLPLLQPRWRTAHEPQRRHLVKPRQAVHR
ncbi:twin-arginine translocation signal domain-containing protein [Xanthomonas fragariae]|uniref:twin-arginine translocation signal domain-containing protein n=1 Tax=Xanthomonas fragariae TaxID=48664 RepID=UPI003D18B538